MSTQKIIAVGGMQHETNTFAPHLAPWEAFERADRQLARIDVG